MKVLLINKCQDCKYDHCKYRQLAGAIPEECPLAYYDSLCESDMDYLKTVDQRITRGVDPE